MIGFFMMVIAISYILAFVLDNPAILYMGVGLALVMNVGSYWFSDKLVLRMTNARQVTKAEAPLLYTTVENLSITAGLPMPKVYVVDDAAPNAFATGRNPEHAVVAATTGLLNILDKNELEGVIAHELAHVGNRDMLVMTVAVVLAGFVAIVADMFSRALMFDGGRENRNPIFLVIGIVGIILAPIAAQLMQMAISRRREYLADATGALLTRYPEGLASALEKISGAARPMKSASHATAHLFISDPFAGGKPSLWQRVGGLFHTHPPAAERIARLRAMDV
jgi:heat shock protein HtpX